MVYFSNADTLSKINARLKKNLSVNSVSKQVETIARTLPGVKADQKSNQTYLLELKKLYPDNLAIVTLEVTDQDSIDAAFDEVSKLTDHLDVLINNAGIDKGNQSLDNINAEMMLETYAVNIISINLCHFVVYKI